MISYLRWEKGVEGGGEGGEGGGKGVRARDRGRQVRRKGERIDIGTRGEGEERRGGVLQPGVEMVTDGGVGDVVSMVMWCQ